MNAIQLSDGYFVRLKPKYTPKLRKEFQKVVGKAQRLPSEKVDESVDASYDALSVFVEKVFKLNPDNTESEDLGLDALMDLDYSDFETVLNGVLEFVSKDSGVYKTIGVTFGVVELSEEEQEKLEKKMMVK